MAMSEELVHDPDHIQNIILDQLRDALDSLNAGDSIGDVIEVDTYKQTITVRFNYNVVEEDDYIGLGTY